MKTLTFIGYMIGALVLELYFFSRFPQPDYYFLVIIAIGSLFACSILLIPHEIEEEKKLKFHKENLSSPKFIAMILFVIINIILYLTF